MQQGVVMRQGISTVMRQGLEVLQASTAELGQLVGQVLATNPVLEEVEQGSPFEEELWNDNSSEEGPRDDWREHLVSSYEMGQQNAHDYVLSSLTSQPSLAEHLWTQLEEQSDAPELLEAGQYLIESINARGFFESSWEDIVKDSPVTELWLKKALSLIQSFDPAGVGAFSLSHCLLLQLHALGKSESLAALLVREHMDDITLHSYADWAKILGVEVKDVQASIEELSRLSLNPGVAYNDDYVTSIVPDFEVFEDDGQDGHKALVFKALRGGIPVLKLSDEYKEKLAESGNIPEVRQYLKECFQQARQLIHSLEHREQTLHKIMHFLLWEQRQFFEQGREYLVPLGMSDAAQVIGVHPTTISRAVSGKYLRCAQGIFELRYFFSSGFVMDSGQQVSQHGVKEAIQRLVREENKSVPLSDVQLVEQLKKMGISVARRTVTKYREQLAISPSHVRKIAY